MGSLRAPVVIISDVSSLKLEIILSALAGNLIKPNARAPTAKPTARIATSVNLMSFVETMPRHEIRGLLF